MPTVENDAAQRYFGLLRQSRQEASPTDSLLKLVWMATKAVEGRDYGTALTVLGGLDEAINIARPALDSTEEQHQDLMEIMLLRKQVLELRRENATLRGDEEAAAECEAAINSMDAFFTASITDLDPER
jgi:hypothetical protein